jgi:hypothetical protein
MTQNVQQIISQLSELSRQLSRQHHDVLKLKTGDFIQAFISLTAAVEQLDSLREIMCSRADILLSHPEETKRKLRKEQIKLIVNNK